MTRIRQYVGSNAVGFLALIVALGGTSYAAVQLPKNSVGAPQIKKNAVRSADVKNSTLKLKDLSKEVTAKLGGGAVGPQGPAGPAGPAGLVGPQGPAGPSTIITSFDGTNFFPELDLIDVGDPITVPAGTWWIRLTLEVLNNDATATQADCQITRANNAALVSGGVSVSARSGKPYYDRSHLTLETPLTLASSAQLKARCSFRAEGNADWVSEVRLSAFSATSIQDQ